MSWKKCHTKLSGILGWNSIQLAYQVIMEKYGRSIFNSFKCLGGGNPLLFSQLCLYHYVVVSKQQHLAVWTIYHYTSSDIQSLLIQLAHLATKVQLSFLRKDGLICQVKIDNKQQPPCIPRNSTTPILVALTTYHLEPHAW